MNTLSRIVPTAIRVAAVMAALPVAVDAGGFRNDGSDAYPTAAPQTNWNAATRARILWATDLPKWSNGSPALGGGRIFVNAEPDTLICLDRQGKILWSRTANYDDVMTPEERATSETRRAECLTLRAKDKEIQATIKSKRAEIAQAAKAAPGGQGKPADVEALKKDLKALEGQHEQLQKGLAAFPYLLPVTHASNGYTSNTPWVDGDAVYVCFGNGVVASFTLDGQRRWIRLLENPVTEVFPDQWGHSGSPIMAGGLLIVHYVHQFGLDPKTGATRWQKTRAHYEGTPAVARLGSLDILFTDNGDVVNAADGATLAATKARTGFASPLIGDDIAFAVGDGKVSAFRLAAGAGGTVTATSLWQVPVVGTDRYFASPLLVDHLLYILSDKRLLTVIDTVKGEKVYEQKVAGLSGVPYTSPVLAGNVIILGSESGKAVVIEPGRTYKEISRPELDGYRSTPVCDGTRMYIRTGASTRDPGKLYCIGD